MYIKSYSELKERKELKKEQMAYIETKLCADYSQLTYKLMDDGVNWWKKIMLGIQIYKQAREVYRHFRQRPE
jgi:predicted phosphoribosyltransferase